MNKRSNSVGCVCTYMELMELKFDKKLCTIVQGYKNFVKVCMPPESKYNGYWFYHSLEYYSETPNCFKIYFYDIWNFNLKTKKETVQLSAEEMCTDLEVYQERIKHNKNPYIAIVKEYANDNTRLAGIVLDETIQIGSLEGKWFWLDDDTKRLADSKGIKLIQKAEQGDAELLEVLKQTQKKLIKLQDYYKEIKSEFKYQKFEDMKDLENKFLNDIEEFILNTKLKFQNLKTKLIGENYVF